MKKLDFNSHTIISLKLPPVVLELVENENYDEIDQLFKIYTSVDGIIYKTLSEYCDFESIEFIISLRESKNDWEEDGIWHDDGSRVLAFSLSLTQNTPEGGVLEIRKRNQSESEKIITPKYGDMIIFKTGVSQFEHKINRVINGKRLIIAGWCS